MTHKDLEVWNLSMDFVVDVYKLSETFPKHEQYAVTSQLRRAATSIPANIAEGCARKGTKELIQFLYISLGSLSEVDTFMNIAFRLNYIKDYDKFSIQLEAIKKKLINLIKSLEKKIN